MTNYRKLFEFYNEHCDGHKAKESRIVEKGETDNSIMIRGNITENGQMNCYECMFIKSEGTDYISVRVYEGKWEQFVDKGDDELIYDEFFDAPNFIDK